MEFGEEQPQRDVDQEQHDDKAGVNPKCSGQEIRLQITSAKKAASDEKSAHDEKQVDGNISETHPESLPQRLVIETSSSEYEGVGKNDSQRSEEAQQIEIVVSAR